MIFFNLKTQALDTAYGGRCISRMESNHKWRYFQASHIESQKYCHMGIWRYSVLFKTYMMYFWEENPQARKYIIYADGTPEYCHMPRWRYSWLPDGQAQKYIHFFQKRHCPIMTVHADSVWELAPRNVTLYPKP